MCLESQKVFGHFNGYLDVFQNSLIICYSQIFIKHSVVAFLLDHLNIYLH